MDEPGGTTVALASRRRWWRWILWPSLFIALCGGVFFFQQWLALSQADNYLPVHLHSLDEADYSADGFAGRIPAVGLSILRDILIGHNPDATDIPERLATVSTVLLTPVPTATPEAGSSGNPENPPTRRPPAGPGPTHTPSEQPSTATMTAPAAATTLPTWTQTATPEDTATATATATWWSPPTATRTPPGPPGTVMPSATPTLVIATDTPLPTLTPSDTPVSTVPPTDTPVPTFTPTDTPVPTATPTDTPVPTFTPTDTPVPTFTPTDTPVPTFTPTDTPVPTFTPTDTPVPTFTPTDTPVPTFTPTDTPVPTFTPTDTPLPTFTPTDTPLPTFTPTDTPVPTFTPTDTPVPTFTPTDTPVPTFTPTDTPVPTFTPTDTPLPTFTPTDTPVPTATPTDTPVPTFTPTDTPLPTFTPTDTPLPTFTPMDTPVPTATPTITATPSCSPPLPVDGILPDGFVQAVDPPDNAVNVAMSRNTITVFYNQPMANGGGGRVDNTNKYDLRTVIGDDKVSLLTAAYDPDTYAVTVTFDTTDSDWLAGTDYSFEINDNVENICGTEQDADVLTSFTTDAPTPTPTMTPTQTPTPTITPTSTPAAGEANLVLTKTDSQDPVNVGSPLTYALLIENLGPAKAADLTLTDWLPADVLYVGTDGSCTYTPGVHRVDCTIAGLLPGNQVTVHIDVLVGPLASGSFTNNASVSSTTPDNDPGNDTDAETTAVGLARLPVSHPGAPADARKTQARERIYKKHPARATPVPGVRSTAAPQP